MAVFSKLPFFMGLVWGARRRFYSGDTQVSSHQGDLWRPRNERVCVVPKCTLPVSVHEPSVFLNWQDSKIFWVWKWILLKADRRDGGGALPAASQTCLEGRAQPPISALAPQSPVLVHEIRTESLRIHYCLFISLCSRQQL